MFLSVTNPLGQKISKLLISVATFSDEAKSPCSMFHLSILILYLPKSLAAPHRLTTFPHSLCKQNWNYSYTCFWTWVWVESASFCKLLFIVPCFLFSMPKCSKTSRWIRRIHCLEQPGTHLWLVSSCVAFTENEDSWLVYMQLLWFHLWSTYPGLKPRHAQARQNHWCKV